MRETRFIAGDPLRALAALSIVVIHAFLQLVLPGDPLGDLGAAVGPVGSIVEGFDLAVYVFFVLSGYLVGRPFIAALRRGDSSPVTAAYFRNRMLRILPAFWVGALLTLVALGAQGSSVKQVAAVFGLAQIYVPSEFANQIAHAWTLGVELAFYIALPVATLLLVRFGRWRSRWLLGLLAAVLVGSLWVRGLRPGDVAFSFSAPAFAGAFVPGLMLAVLEGTSLQDRKWLPSVVLLAALPAAVLFTVTDFGDYRLRSAFGIAASGCLVGGLLLRQWCGKGCPRILDNPFMHWVGERSLSLYVLHVLVLHYVARWLEGPTTLANAFAYCVATILVSLPVAALSYRFIERPFLRLRASRTASPPVKAGRTAYVTR